MNYQKLMNQNPFLLESIVNSKCQNICFYEHPILGDSSDIICVCHKLKLAAHSGFFDLDDMTASHKEYEPSFENGKLYIGGFEA